MPTGDWFEARDGSDTWDMPVKPPNSGDEDRRTEAGSGGQRPGRVLSPRRRAARGLLALGAVVIVAVAGAGTQAGAIEAHFARPVYDVVSISTSASDRAHPSANLTDPWNNTWWGSGTAAPGTTLKALFRRPVNLADVAITPGAGPTARDYRSEDSPVSMTMTLIGQHGSSTTQVLPLPSSPGARIFPVHGDGITEARLTITSVNAEGGPGSQVAIADLEFFSR